MCSFKKECGAFRAKEILGELDKIHKDFIKAFCNNRTDNYRAMKCPFFSIRPKTKEGKG